MAFVTIRILDGDDQGRVFSRVELPVSIGREDGNGIQLNDIFVSRYHVKLREHSDRLILTDLGSTCGTRVNGRHAQMRILQVGDIIAVGRSVLVLTDRQRQQNEDESSLDDSDPGRTAFLKGGGTIDDDSSLLDFAHPLPGIVEEPVALFPKGRPECPSDIRAVPRPA